MESGLVVSVGLWPASWEKVTYRHNEGAAQREVRRALQRRQEMLKRLKERAATLPDGEKRRAVRGYIFSDTARLAHLTYQLETNLRRFTVPARHLIETARSIRMDEPEREPVRMFFKTKPTGKSRAVFDYPLRAKVRQKVIKDVARAVCGIGDHQYGCTKGAVAARRDLAEAIRTNPFAYVVSADIQSFFDSISLDAVVDAAMLPRGVAETVLSEDSYRVQGQERRPNDASSVPRPNSTCEGPSGARPRLATGSACSSHLAEAAIANLRSQIEERVGQSVSIFVYVDDIVILARTRDEAERLWRVLADVLNEHPAGPFSLRGSHADAAIIRSLEEGFTFLGAVFQRLPSGALWVDREPDAALDFIVGARQELNDCYMLRDRYRGHCDGMTYRGDVPAALRQRIEGARGAFPDCRGFLRRLKRVETTEAYELAVEFGDLGVF